jgi:hypothetical protein
VSIETQALLVYLVSLSLVILMKIVCFILGYLTIRLGYQLMASGVKGDFKFNTSLVGFKADLASVSPGLLFVLLGILLIGFAVYIDKPVNVNLPSPMAQQQTGTHQQQTDTPPEPPIPGPRPMPGKEGSKK